MILLYSETSSQVKLRNTDAQAGLRICCSQPPKTAFLTSRSNNINWFSFFHDSNIYKYDAYFIGA